MSTTRKIAFSALTLSCFLYTHKLQLDTNCLILKTTCEYTPNGDDVLGISSPWKYSGWELGRMTSIPGKVVGCWLNDLSNQKNKNHNLRNKPSSSQIFTLDGNEKFFLHNLRYSSRFSLMDYETANRKK